MTHKPTPGPWWVGSLDPAGQRIVRQEHIEICTCWHHSVTSIEKEMEANARLIAAAPDLLEFANHVLATDPDSYAPLFVWARAAIAKAAGEQS
jgi:hypothetical protein